MVLADGLPDADEDPSAPRALTRVTRRHALPSLAAPVPDLVFGLAVGIMVGGKYELARRLRMGGLTESWLAREAGVAREVEIEFVNVAKMGDPRAGAVVAKRFRALAAASERLAPFTRHIVTVYETGVHLGSPYVVTEHFVGQSVDAVVRVDGPMDREVLAEVLLQVATALDAGRRAGLLHGDLDAGKVILLADAGEEIRVKVSGFGALAPALLDDADLLDPRADAQALGKVAHEALGRPRLRHEMAEWSDGRRRRGAQGVLTLPEMVDAWFARAMTGAPVPFDSASDAAAAFREALDADELWSDPPHLPVKPIVGPGKIAVVIGLAAAILFAVLGGRSTLAPARATVAQDEQVSAAPPPPTATPPVPSSTAPVAPAPVNERAPATTGAVGTRSVAGPVAQQRAPRPAISTRPIAPPTVRPLVPFPEEYEPARSPYDTEDPRKIDPSSVQ